MFFIDIEKELTAKMNQVFEHLEKMLSGLRTGRASTGLVDSIKVEAYGDYVPVTQVASVNVLDARLLSINVWDTQLVPSVIKAIEKSNLGLTPQVEGNLLRLAIPELSEERRKELMKKSEEYAEQSKVQIRNIRRNGMDDVKKAKNNKEISEDEMYVYLDDIQKLTDDFVEKVKKRQQEKAQNILGK